MTIQNTSPSGDRVQGGGSSPSDAYRAVREGAFAAAVFPRQDRSRFRVAGPDRHSWLQGLITNDVAGLAPGQGRYAAYLTPQGRMITDMRVLAAEDSILIEVPAVVAGQVLDRLQSFIIMEDVTIDDITSESVGVSVHGGAAARVVAAAITAVMGADASEGSGVDATAFGELGELSSVFAGDLHITASHEFGPQGFDIQGPPASVAHLRAALLAAGAVEGDDRTWEVLRIEAGRPAFGQDMDETTIPLEAGIEDRAISFTKGCYVGQEVIIRVVHRGHGRVARRLVGLRVGEGSSGQTEVLVAHGDVLSEGTGAREIGRITSAAFSPHLHTTIALGYVQRDFTEPGTQVSATHEGKPLSMVVTLLPFL